VRYFRNILFTLAALLWLPASAHCQLESIDGLEFLHCTAVNEPVHCATSEDCSECGCFALEKSHYRSEQLTFTLQLPVFLPVSPAPLAAANILPVEVTGGQLTTAPPQLLKTWQFASRMALPARAPSLAS
jgi:hypothetical protein